MAIFGQLQRADPKSLNRLSQNLAKLTTSSKQPHTPNQFMPRKGSGQGVVVKM